MQPNSPTPLPPKRPLSIDGVVRRHPLQPSALPPKRPLHGASSPAVSRTPGSVPVVRFQRLPHTQPRQAVHAVKPRQQSRRNRRWLPWLLTLAVIATGALVSHWLILGIAVLTIYAICMLIFNVKSGFTYGLAAITLTTTTAALFTQTGTEMAGSFAAYTFLLIILGTVSLVREVSSGTSYGVLHSPHGD